MTLLGRPWIGFVTLAAGLVACSGGRLGSIGSDDAAVGDDAPVGPGLDLGAQMCGDSRVFGGEACDDGNTVGGDGCSANCLLVEPGFSCPSAQGFGGACMRINMARCGDGMRSPGEFCDDGNTVNGDGCSNQCSVEGGYDCPVFGKPCNLVESCGDGKMSVATREECDDGNKTGGDGCSATCVLETNFTCPEPGKPCTSTVKCGDRKVTGDETCDDGNTGGGDGCSAMCKVENGWSCPAGSTCRPARCGDGLKVGPEQCDDGNATASDGCEANCTVTLPTATETDGWTCPVPGQPCIRTTCGNGTQEGSEQCDDGDNDSGDGCSPFCRKEPVCPAAGGACMTACGDGLLLPIDKTMGQECDDGNTVSGDGCSTACKTEPGFMCADMALNQTTLTLPVILRDFKAFNAPANGHQDFQQFNGCESGIVQDMLGANGKPVHVTSDMTKTANDYTPDVAGTLTGTDWFASWYADDAATNKTVRDTITFTRLPSGAFQFRADDSLTVATDGFFPLDGKGWMDDQTVTTGTPAVMSTRNFFFTSEVRYWFEYKGGEKLDFTGDDDVWVFLNKRLAVDIGGVHGAKNGSITLGTDGTGVAVDWTPGMCGTTRTRTLDFQMVVGGVYEIVVFQAERHTSASAYRLTLSNFTAIRSSCNTVCGDGVVAGAEACDLGTAGNTGAYGTCNANCTLPPRCGDGMVQTPPEQCDDGVNLSTYGGANKVCAPGCLLAPYCGDGKVDSARGEACDQGVDNGKGYGFCAAACQLGPRCGDGIVSNGEECDGTPGCTTACKVIVIP